MIHVLATLSSAFNDPFTIEVEPEKLLKFKIDPLVLSCCQYRHSDPNSENYNPTVSHTSLNYNPDYLYDKVAQEDHDLANKIRTYYQGKIAFAKLRGGQMSQFRQDLGQFISTSWTEDLATSDRFIGMLYKLPYFYEHDLLLSSEVFETEYHEIKNPIHGKDEVTLTYIRSLDERQKRNPSIKYWFKDNNENRLCVSIEKTNSLIPTWERFIEKPITIKGNYIERAYDTLHFYKVNPGWKIIG
jgi:hypothetical protein